MRENFRWSTSQSCRANLEAVDAGDLHQLPQATLARIAVRNARGLLDLEAHGVGANLEAALPEDLRHACREPMPQQVRTAQDLRASKVVPLMQFADVLIELPVDLATVTRRHRDGDDGVLRIGDRGERELEKADEVLFRPYYCWSRGARSVNVQIDSLMRRPSFVSP